MVILGSVPSDTIYGITALFGIASFLEPPWIMAAFSAVGAVVLWIIAFLTFKESKKLRWNVVSMIATALLNSSEKAKIQSLT